MTVVTITALCNPPHPLFKQNDYQHFYYVHMCSVCYQISMLDREHHDVLRINYKGRSLVRLAQLSFIIYG